MQVETFSEGTVSGRVEANNAWEALMANRMNTVNMGAVITTEGGPSGPETFSINGRPCAVNG